MSVSHAVSVEERHILPILCSIRVIYWLPTTEIGARPWNRIKTRALNFRIAWHRSESRLLGQVLGGGGSSRQDVLYMQGLISDENKQGWIGLRRPTCESGSTPGGAAGELTGAGTEGLGAGGETAAASTGLSFRPETDMMESFRSSLDERVRGPSTVAAEVGVGGVVASESDEVEFLLPVGGGGGGTRSAGEV